jgi:hypothetical protein
MNGEAELLELLASAEVLARRYRDLTGRPLGVTGEIAEFEAARLLDLELAPVREAGYDAVRIVDGRQERLQIKGRCLLPGAKPGQRMGRIDRNKPADAVLLVILDQYFEATTIYEAPWSAVVEALCAPGSKARNEHGALGVSKFKRIGRQVWPPAA